MPRFILVDHSIVDHAGHYYEYARRVLDAARDKGFETVLAVNQRAQISECSHPIRKVFRYTFWECQRTGVLSRFKLAFSSRVRTPEQSERTQRFASDLEALFASSEIGADDIVLVPTLGSAELVAIAAFLAKRGMDGRNWHLLFRRDIGGPYSPLDLVGRAVKNQLVGGFVRSREILPNARWNFYTDTAELSSAYNALKIGTFKTLPIPVEAPEPADRSEPDRPITVTFPGDARIEKGAHLIPGLIRAARAAGFGPDRVRFVVQGNMPNEYSGRHGKKLRRAISNAEKLGAEVICQQLDSRGYQRLLKESDLVVLPYKAVLYRRRSSGVFAEAMAAGIPSIVPAGTWMANSTSNQAVKSFSGTKQLLDDLVESIKHSNARKQLLHCDSESWRRHHLAASVVNNLLSRNTFQ